MSDSIENTELFDKAYLKLLSEEERETFTGRLINDEAFKSAYESHIRNINIIKTISVQDEIKIAIEQAEVPEKRVSKIKYLIPVAIAAALALTLILLPKKAMDNNALFDEYFSPYPNAITSRADESDLQDALKFYSSRQFEKAIEGFELLPEGDEVLFYKSLSHLALKQPEKALTGFRALDQNGIFHKESLWFRGLSFLLVNKSDSIIHYMERIEESNPKYESAQKILEQTSRR